jgi:predicted HTH transcriptional regulator
MIANAVLHRSYLDKSCVQVCLYDDRLEVSSPGMLYGGLDLKTAKLGKSTCRNEVIAEAFHYMHIVEAWGTGLPRIINRCKEYGLPDPLFEEFGDGFKVTLFRKVSNAPELLQGKNDSNEEKTVGSKKKQLIEKEKTVVSEEKQLIGEEKTVDSEKKQSFEQMMEQLKFSKPTENNIRILHEHIGDEVFFGRADIIQIIGITSSPAGNLLKKMKNAQLIEEIKGQGKGRYKFRA